MIWRAVKTVARRAGVTLALAAMVWGCGAYHDHMKKGDELYQNQQYELALAQYEAAARLDPEEEEPQQKIEEVKRQLVDIYGQEARAKLQAQDYLGAVVLAGKAQAKMAEYDATRKLVREVSDAVRQRADALVGEDDFAQGLDLLQAVYNELPSERAAVEPRLEEVKTGWGVRLREKGEAAEAAGQPATALLYYAKVAQLMPTSPEVARRDRLRQELLEANAYRVQLRLQGRDGTDIVKRTLEQAGNGTALVVLGPRERAPKGEEIDALMRVDLDRPRHDKDTSQRAVVVQYQSGTRQVPNPFYKSKQDEILRLERDVQRYQEDVNRYQRDLNNYQQQVAREGHSPNTSTGAEQGVSRSQSSLERAQDNLMRAQDRVLRAKEELARTDQFKEEPVYSDHQYIITRHTMVATLPMKLRIAHEASGREPIEADKVLEVAASDETHAPQPIANVAGDPLDLPPRADLERDLLGAAGALAAEHLQKSFADHRTAALAGVDALPDDDARLEAWTLYIISDPTLVDARVPVQISRISGIPDPVAVLRAAPATEQPAP